MGQWPILTQRDVAALTRSLDNKKPLSGAFTHQEFDGALTQDYTALLSAHATSNIGYFLWPIRW